MAEAPVARSPLAHRAPRDGPLTLREAPPLGLLELRVGTEDARHAVAAVLELALPDANRVAAGGRHSVLWLGPDAFLVVTSAAAAAALQRALSQALHGRRGAVTEVSDGRAVIELGGGGARDILAAGCGLDLHPRVFGSGQCAQSALAKARILLHQFDDAPAYRLFVDRSLGEYLWLWLVDAAGVV